MLHYVQVRSSIDRKTLRTYSIAKPIVFTISLTSFCMLSILGWPSPCLLPSAFCFVRYDLPCRRWNRRRWPTKLVTGHHFDHLICSWHCFATDCIPKYTQIFAVWCNRFWTWETLSSISMISSLCHNIFTGPSNGRRVPTGCSHNFLASPCVTTRWTSIQNLTLAEQCNMYQCPRRWHFFWFHRIVHGFDNFKMDYIESVVYVDLRRDQ
jgi:hypothetical protein